MVMAMFPREAVTTICPVYVPAGRVRLAFTVAITTCGVLQDPPPVHPPPIDADNQLPPVAVEAWVTKPKFAPVLTIVSTCGSGFAPPNALVKLIGFI